jgi:hypothetical protein
VRHWLVLVAALLVALPGGARGDDATITDATPPPDASPPFVKDRAANGDHWRFETARGPVHVWTPPGYDAATAGIVLYVHGHIHNVDQAWTQHKLAEQFLASEQNALFIAMEAPISRRDTVKWPSLAGLLREVRRQTGLIRPWGHVVAIGHSGAYTTILRWLDYRPLDTVVLLDGLYGHEEYFEDWVYRSAGHDDKRLTVVAADTLRWSEPFARRNKGVVTVDLVPTSYEEVEPTARRAKVLYMRSQFPHMEIVSQGKVMPVALRLTRLPRLE